jgi:thioredoxin-like negative regulator of GroEL
VKVDVDAEPELAQRLGITSIPTLMLFHRGALVGSQVGAPGKAQLREAVERAFRLPATV